MMASAVVRDPKWKPDGRKKMTQNVTSTAASRPGPSPPKKAHSKTGSENKFSINRPPQTGASASRSANVVATTDTAKT